MKSVLVVAVLLAVTSCDGGPFSGRDIEGSGTIVTESRPVASFDGVIIQGAGVINIDVAGTPSLQISADDNILGVLTSAIEEQTLVLSVENDTSIDPTEPVRYDITMASFQGISVIGSATVVVTSIDSASVTVDIAGSGDIQLSGTAGDLAVDIRGSGAIEAGDLEVRTSGIDISGSGDVLVNVSDELLITISGSGDVVYVGDPRVEQTISGTGSVTSR